MCVGCVHGFLGRQVEKFIKVKFCVLSRIIISEFSRNSVEIQPGLTAGGKSVGSAMFGVVWAVVSDEIAAFCGLKTWD